ncbi:Lytic transglycosylase catalytic [Hydrogenobacter thermophilus TK-6]|uniref:lytic transglycosylase domain-containing protein n=1 Tax=Hydrogenobacter thermophilus TaxID=940 RepID=UPI0001E6569B|nr:lytic transglycosylase domain-containing protein [Hydrogenobacter thermophilus]ADO45587.1 Lytic transglycosylase catalytic [Hydrogenobacter thermophilus TK-6]
MLDISACFDKASYETGVNRKLLVVIAYVESGLRSDALNRNSNGTYDIGLMQINSSNIPKLKRMGIIQKEEDLWDTCTNIRAGAYLLKECIAIYDLSWRAVDCYNKGSKAKDISKYVWKVYKVLSTVR